MDKYITFREWIINNGGKIENLEYPAAFHHNGVLLGTAATRDLKPGDLIIDIPVSLTVNRKTIRKSSIGHLMEKHPEIFDKHEEVDMSHVIWAFYEKLKQPEGCFWTPWFNIINITHLPAFWDDA